MELPGGVQEILGRIADASERTAKANEELITLAKDERDLGESELGPPFCPHCGKFDPEIRNEGGAGLMSEFVLVAYCESCTKTFIAVPQGWMCHKTPEEAAQQKGGT